MNANFTSQMAFDVTLPSLLKALLFVGGVMNLLWVASTLLVAGDAMLL